MLPFHEIANLFPLLEGADFEALKKDIQAHGVREPVWTYQGKIIDGRNRARACAELGIEPPTREWDGNGSLADFVLSLNLHRRHLSPEQKRAIVAAMLKEAPERSNRQVAEQAKVDHKTVGAARRRLEASGEIPQTEKARGKDGRKRPVRRPAPQPLPGGRPAAEADEAEDFEAKVAVMFRFESVEEMRQAQAVAMAGEADPARFGDLVQQMDTTHNIAGAFEELERRRREGAGAPGPSRRPRYPHSDRLVTWMEHLMSQAHIIRLELGGIRALVQDRTKWDWHKVRDYLLPMLADAAAVLEEFRKEIGRGAKEG
jgi:hypothetical protein